MKIYTQALQRHQWLVSQLQQLDTQIKKLPKGSLICARDGKHFKWYHSDGHKKTYIPKKKEAFAQQLAAKKYFIALKKDYQHEKMALEFYLKHHLSTGGHAEKLLLKNSEFQRLLSPLHKPISQELDEWMHAPYEKYMNFPEKLIHSTPAGHKVRSKSEALIATFLYENKIPYRYEPTLQLGESIIHPDFETRHPISGKTIYWEHFGMMDYPNYVKTAADKMHLLLCHGFIPGINLITTFETSGVPLCVDEIIDIIQRNFLQ